MLLTERRKNAISVRVSPYNETGRERLARGRRRVGEDVERGNAKKCALPLTYTMHQNWPARCAGVRVVFAARRGGPGGGHPEPQVACLRARQIQYSGS